ncbi:Hfi1p [Sugiyamaella lignohabitans]|uniref:Hfi1p n=1 Tax=Sugiyamaella lignohabitans TaxID=796027 RepID=A0A167EZK7_9ASCO|nr:Hfi1p [Sugiyamaella lignohabitans]ANB14642.1 Hfi1p [Sugiyamaella lignohabitans]
MASPALLMNGNLAKNILNGGSSAGSAASVGTPGPSNGGGLNLEGNGMTGAITPAKTISGSALSTNPTLTVPTKAISANSPQAQSMTGNTSSSKRLDVDTIMIEFQKSLGDNWDRYRDVITSFLIGRLTRFELQEELDQILDKNAIKLHNHFLLTNLANSLRDPPPGEQGSLSGWFKKQKDGARNVKGDSQLAKLKEDILGLSVRERKRIKAIARVRKRHNQPLFQARGSNPESLNSRASTPDSS